MNRNSLRHGFTLVEILIVVVILGILAAIVVPQFTNASESAKSNSLYTQLQTLRSQFELYQVQHNGNYPDLNGDGANDLWTCMTSKTDVTGTVSAAGAYGPYLQQDPKNPFTGKSVVKADSSGDWQYGGNGVIKAVLPAGTTMAATGLTANDAVEAAAP
jgi:general secretion pathway protein G